MHNIYVVQGSSIAFASHDNERGKKCGRIYKNKIPIHIHVFSFSSTFSLTYQWQIICKYKPIEENEWSHFWAQITIMSKEDPINTRLTPNVYVDCLVTFCTFSCAPQLRNFQSVQNIQMVRIWIQIAFCLCHWEMFIKLWGSVFVAVQHATNVKTTIKMQSKENNCFELRGLPLSILCWLILPRPVPLQSSGPI